MVPYGVSAELALEGRAHLEGRHIVAVGQCYRNDRADADGADEAERAAVRLDDTLADGQAETGASLRADAGRVCAVETLGKVGQVLGRDSLARIRHADDEIAILHAGAQRYRPIVVR